MSAQLDVKHFDFDEIGLEITIAYPGARKEFINEISFFTGCPKSSSKEWVLRIEPDSSGKAEIYPYSFF